MEQNQRKHTALVRYIPRCSLKPQPPGKIKIISLRKALLTFSDSQTLQQILRISRKTPQHEIAPNVLMAHYLDP